jgi:hypothetical protein
MAITLSTTLANACTAADRTIKLTSGTSAAVGMLVKMEQEWSSIAAIASDGVTITLGLRGANGSAVVAHKALSAVEVSAGIDFAGSPQGSGVTIPLTTPAVTYYGGPAQIAIPDRDGNIFLNGTGADAMFLVAPGTDIDGRTLTIMASAAHAYTVSVGVSGAVTATGYKNTAGTATFGGAIGDNMVIMACKGQWDPVSTINVTFA